MCQGLEITELSLHPVVVRMAAMAIPAPALLEHVPWCHIGPVEGKLTNTASIRRLKGQQTCCEVHSFVVDRGGPTWLQGGPRCQPQPLLRNTFHVLHYICLEFAPNRFGKSCYFHCSTACVYRCSSTECRPGYTNDMSSDRWTSFLGFEGKLTLG